MWFVGLMVGAVIGAIGGGGESIFVGGIAGIILGALASWRLLLYIGALLNLQIDFAIAWQGIALGAAVGIGVTLIGGLIPAISGTGIRVKDALEA